MIKRFDDLIYEAIDLLEQCGYYEKSIWFLERMNVLKNENIHSDVFKQTVIEIKSILGGMGSFSDLSMVPTPGAKISAEEARLRQWDLCEEIYDEICALLQQ